MNSQKAALLLSLLGFFGLVSAAPSGKDMIRSDNVADTSRCSGFQIQSKQPKSTDMIPISSLVVCSKNNTEACPISEAIQFHVTMTSSLSTTDGKPIEGVFDYEATFGEGYNMTSTSEFIDGWSVLPGQQGYLSTVFFGALFQGTFTGCDLGDTEQAGSVLAYQNGDWSGYGPVLNAIE